MAEAAIVLPMSRYQRVTEFSNWMFSCVMFVYNCVLVNYRK